jgi:hypothetical protein
MTHQSRNLFPHSTAEMLRGIEEAIDFTAYSGLGDPFEFAIPCWMRPSPFEFAIPCWMKPSPSVCYFWEMAGR